MVEKREAFAPWSLTRKAGVQSATVNGTIDVVQEIRPTLTTGFIDESGDWKGLKSSEEQFHSFGNDEAIANGATILAPQSASGTVWPLDMTGYDDVMVAIKPTNGGNYSLTAVMGPADFAFANLRDVNPNSILIGAPYPNDDNATLYNDGAQSLTADVWNIVIIQQRLKSQKLLQFRIVNNSGGESDIETAFLRLV